MKYALAIVTLLIVAAVGWTIAAAQTTPMPADGAAANQFVFTASANSDFYGFNAESPAYGTALTDRGTLVLIATREFGSSEGFKFDPTLTISGTTNTYVVAELWNSNSNSYSDIWEYQLSTYAGNSQRLVSGCCPLSSDGHRFQTGSTYRVSLYTSSTKSTPVNFWTPPAPEPTATPTPTPTATPTPNPDACLLYTSDAADE